MKKASEYGFSLLEILVAIAIFVTIFTVITATMTGALKLNSQSQTQLSTTSQVQQVMESIRGSWNLPPSGASITSAYYDRACAPSSINLNNATAKYINLNSRGQPIDNSGAIISNPSSVSIALSNNCGSLGVVQMSNGSPYPMRRLIVSTGTGPQDVTLSLDILRPQ